MTAADLRGREVLVLGLGRFGGGLGVTRWLLDQGARVTVTDRAPREALAEPAAAAEDAGARLALGGHDGVRVADHELLVVNPAVPLTAPLVAEAREAGVPLTSEIALLMERWPGPLVGVTGSNGKSTTVGLLQALLEAAGVPAVAGGNLGGSLLARLDGATPRTVAVLELSSFMLELLPELGLGPEVALLTNLTPNHLDRHGTMEAYRDAKAGILTRARAAVLPAGDPWLAPLAEGLPADAVSWFGDQPGDQSGGQPGDAPGDGAAAGPSIGSRPIDLGPDPSGDLLDREGRRVLVSGDIPLAGRMNRLNLAAAALTAGALLDDLPRVLEAAPRALAAYRPPPHRLEAVSRRGGVLWVDDSTSTTPESTAASLEAVGGALPAPGRRTGQGPRSGPSRGRRRPLGPQGAHPGGGRAPSGPAAQSGRNSCRRGGYRAGRGGQGRHPGAGRRDGPAVARILLP